MSRRDQIRMTDDEVAGFLEEQRVVVVATIGRDGWAHLMPLWYVVRDGELWAWTYAASQKVKNLERDDRATLQIEAGVEYAELRGVMIKAHVELHRDVEAVSALGAEIFRRYTAGGEDGELASEVADMVAKQAAKRVGLRFAPHETATWDHRKLAGTY